MLKRPHASGSHPGSDAHGHGTHAARGGPPAGAGAAGGQRRIGAVVCRIGTLVGRGGFGQVFLASRLGASQRVPATLCVKVSTRQDGWLREAYFGQLLDGQPRAVTLYDAFPFFGGEGRLLYGLAFE
ncbi:MAG: hypothetical protein R2708_23955 [Vicinamibacterales bacterium]